jgi:quercetin dioxygenase-like cupin family protein
LASDGAAQIEAAQVVLPSAKLDETVEFFTSRLGFRVDAVLPADDPVVVVVSGHGVRLRLDREVEGDPGVLRLSCSDPLLVADGAMELRAPNGTRIELAASDPPLVLPPLQSSLVVTKLTDESVWGEGRAGMRYRDLLPDRLGGRFIASHIRILDAGPVPDYVHFHKVRFQMIFCYRGWVRVVYEDQGPPFVLRAGDCVLQPPQIRHRVLESGDGLEVIEIGCPADHETHADHRRELPTATVDPEHEYGGQRFVHHEAATAAWADWRLPGFQARDIGIAAATDGLANVLVVRPRTGTTSAPGSSHDGEFSFLFVLDGSVELRVDGHGAESLSTGDCVSVPPGSSHSLHGCSEDLELLEVSLP